MEIYTVEGTRLKNTSELFDYFKEQASKINAERKARHEEMRDWELLQLSKHIQQFKGEFNDADSLKLLATNLEVQSKLVRDQIETM